MADSTHETIDAKTRANLAYFWSGTAALILAYIVVMWGQEKEILTLIIGLVGGTILGSIFSIYFGGSIAKKNDAPLIQQTGNSPTATTGTSTSTEVTHDEDK